MEPGGSESFERFFVTALPRAIRTAYRILGTVTEAEDAAAEAFARAHASWRRVGALPYREAWLLRVTANVAIDMARRKRPDHVPIADEGTDPEEVAVLHVALAAALGLLPRRQREVVVLHYLEGFTEAEIAEALQVSPGTVKKAMSRARQALRDRMGDAWMSSTPVLVGPTP